PIDDLQRRRQLEGTLIVERRWPALDPGFEGALKRILRSIGRRLQRTLQFIASAETGEHALANLVLERPELTAVPLVDEQRIGDEISGRFFVDVERRVEREARHHGGRWMIPLVAVGSRRVGRRRHDLRADRLDVLQGPTRRRGHVRTTCLRNRARRSAICSLLVGGGVLKTLSMITAT